MSTELEKEAIKALVQLMKVVKIDEDVPQQKSMPGKIKARFARKKTEQPKHDLKPYMEEFKQIL
ncbi:hypothetical protein Ciccas_008085, partial [Cichlidogyrus casuarinus]